MNTLPKRRKLGTIRFFLLLGFAVILGLSLLIAVIGYMSLTNLQNSIQVALNEAVAIRDYSLQIENDFLSARQYESNFLDNWRLLGFDEAENRFMMPYTTAIESAQTQLDELISLIDRVNTPQLRRVRSEVDALAPLLETYADTFNDTRQAVQQRSESGGTEQTLQRHWEAMREYVEDLSNRELFELLMLIKVNEQAYFNTRQQSFLDNIRILALQFVRLAPNFFNAPMTSEFLPDTETVLNRLTEYQATLNELVVLDQDILANSELGRDVASNINIYTNQLNVVAQNTLIQSKIDQQQISNQSTIALVGTATISFIVGLLIAVALLRRILIPLNRLRVAAQRIDGGNLDNPPVVVPNQDEFATLADVFNQMTGRLRVFVSDLENLVEARTHDLSLAKAEAERANKIKSQFLANMSHELRTPLNAILNFTQFVSNGMFGEVNAKQVEMLEIVVNNGRHLLALINDILDISKIESGALELFIEENINIVPEIEEAIRSGEATIRERDVEVEIIRQFDPNLPRITGDRRRIRQVMLNLITNACKFTEEGSITIIAKPDDLHHVLLIVKDTGMGIPESDFGKIFENFRQADAGKKHGGGTGLGLPISRKLVEAHGGKIWLESVVGEGTTFYVRLPVMALGT
ncbi:MAG: ATP-binding protein [Anaerolineae bacterium]|nr:ATP-binding protein [Anaerolineae bacterium]